MTAFIVFGVLFLAAVFLTCALAVLTAPRLRCNDDR